jgi:hypothetical protein
MTYFLRFTDEAKFTADLPADWDTYLVTPASPVRVFAGDQPF